MSTTFAVFISLTTFFAILFYMKVHKKVAGALDARAQNIKREIDEARQLREDAQSLLAAFERRHAEVNDIADEIVENAKSDAQAYVEKAKADLEHVVQTRLDAAQLQIKFLEQQAVRNIRQQAVAVAIGSIQDALRSDLSNETIRETLDASLDKISHKFH